MVVAVAWVEYDAEQFAGRVRLVVRKRDSQLGRSGDGRRGKPNFYAVCVPEHAVWTAGRAVAVLK